MLPHKKVNFVILSAMQEEMTHLEEHFADCESRQILVNKLPFKIIHYKDQTILIAYTGIGTTFAASIVTLLHAHFQPDYFFLLGTAGGIHPEIKIRDVVIADHAFEAEMLGIHEAVKNTPFAGCLIHPLNNQAFPSRYSADSTLLAIANDITMPGIRTRVGTVISSNAFPAPLALFKQIKNENNLAIDMETSAFYQVAWLLNLRALSVRGVSNMLDLDGRDEQLHASDLTGSMLAATTVLVNIIEKLIEANSTFAVKNSLPEVDAIIAALKLSPHPEGGYYIRNHESRAHVFSADDTRYQAEKRLAGTSIYYLLHGTDFSAWHRLRSDEVWHYYKGSSVVIHTLDKQGNLLSHKLGDPALHPEASFQVVVEADTWFAAEVEDKTHYSLIGATVSPGFEFKDFEMADKDQLTLEFPQHQKIIARLSRD